MSEILQKFIASSGLCSRRKATNLIEKGRVQVNGLVAELGMRVEDSDKVEVDGHEISQQDKLYIKLNKPAGYTCTNKKFKKEKNIFDIIRIFKKGLFSAGRLDKNTRGLALITNDGNLSNRLAHPSYGHEKEYLVRASGMYEGFDKEVFMKACKEGFAVPEIGVVKMKNIVYLGKNRFRTILVEGKKRQIRRMFEKFGLGVPDLKRVRVDKLTLGDLSEGEWRYLTEKEINDLM